MVLYLLAYFLKGHHKVNLIAINWENASNTINYPSARNSVGIIGEHTAKFIDFMVSTLKIFHNFQDLTDSKFSKTKFQVENEQMKLSQLIVIGFR